MLKRLTFDTPSDRRNFEQFWDAVILGSQAGAPAGKPRAQIRREAMLQRKLIAVSEPVPAAEIDRTTRPSNARALKAGPQVVDLTVEEITLAGELAEKVAWGGLQVVAVADLFDFLESAPTAPETP